MLQHVFQSFKRQPFGHLLVLTQLPSTRKWPSADEHLEHVRSPHSKQGALHSSHCSFCYKDLLLGFEIQFIQLIEEVVVTRSLIELIHWVFSMHWPVCLTGIMLGIAQDVQKSGLFEHQEQSNAQETHFPIGSWQVEAGHS